MDGEKILPNSWMGDGRRKGAAKVAGGRDGGVRHVAAFQPHSKRNERLDPGQNSREKVREIDTCAERRGGSSGTSMGGAVDPTPNKPTQMCHTVHAGPIRTLVHRTNPNDA